MQRNILISRLAAIALRTIRWPIDPRGAARGRTERAAVIVAIRDDTGATGLGEAAPLPGMSIDTLDEVEGDLRRATAGLPEMIVMGDLLGDIAARARAGVPAMNECVAARVRELAGTAQTPAGRFAIETALLVLVAQRARTSVAELWRADPARTIACAVVVDDPDEARAAVERGARWLKIKSGDPAIVARIARVAPGARLRLDVNRSWSRDSARARLADLAALPIDFVEEPCAEAHELLAAPLSCPIALDESLATLDAAQLARALRSPDLAALILKPTLLGGFARCIELAELARQHDVVPIVSHALEGPIGTAACAELARAIGGDVAVGLAPYVRHFAETA